MSAKKLYVVLSRSNTILSGLIHMIKEDEYTHAALALDKNLEYMFSFGRRYTHNPFYGCFKREQLNKGVYAQQKNLPGLIMELTVSEHEYRQVKGMVEDFLLNRHLYTYNYMGLLSGMLGISHYSHNRFLCSEFVYYVLHQCGICDLGLPRNLVRPQNLTEIDAKIIYQGNLKHYAQNAPRSLEPFPVLALAR